jgi:hypothetical protein
MGQSRNTIKHKQIYRLIVREKGRFVDEAFAEFSSLKQNGIRASARRRLLTALLIGSFAVFPIRVINILTPTFVKSRGLAK